MPFGLTNAPETDGEGSKGCERERLYSCVYR